MKLKQDIKIKIKTHLVKENGNKKYNGKTHNEIDFLKLEKTQIFTLWLVIEKKSTKKSSSTLA